MLTIASLLRFANRYAGKPEWVRSLFIRYRGGSGDLICVPLHKSSPYTIDMGKSSTGSQNRPIFLDLFRIHFPIGAVASILHRISGVILLVAVPAALGLIAHSSRSPAHFRQVDQWLDGPLATLGLALILAASLHHLFAGLRILFMDAGVGVRLPLARWTAWASLTLAVLGGLGLLVRL